MQPILGPLLMLLFLALVAAATVASLRPFPGAPPRRRPLQILEEPFARGEIAAEEFTARSRALKR